MEKIIIVTQPDRQTALQCLADEANAFTAWVASVVPELKDYEAVTLTASLLSMYVEQIKQDPNAISAIKGAAQKITSYRSSCQAN